MAIKLERLVNTYYEKLEEGKIMGRKCPKCGNVEWPPTYACNECGQMETEWYEMSGRGEIVELYMPSALTAKPWYAPYMPYAYAWIRCEEGTEKNAMVRYITKENEAYIRAHMPYPIHMEIIQCDGYKSAVFAIDPIDGEGNPVPATPQGEPISSVASASVFDSAPAEEAVTEVAAPAKVEADPAIVASLIELVADSYKVDVEGLSADSTFGGDLKGASVIFVGLVAEIENEFDIIMNITDAGAAQTIGELAIMIKNLM